jgi:sigma-B regulation protein RsbU (phosphoserine phosphatase)
MFFRNAAGKTSMAAIAGKESSGGLIGIKNIPVEYTGIKFKMSPGDAIIIYTDCLYESKDVNGVEFGTDRIKTAFEHASGRSAQEKLNQVLGEFREYTEGAEIKDDLTMIVIVKK